MTNDVRATVTLGVQAGDPKANDAVTPHYQELRRLLAAQCAKSYGADFIEFAPVLRIDGDIWHWNKSGFDNVRINKKSKIATFDVYLAIEAWKDQPAEIIRRHIIEGVHGGMREIVDKAQKQKLDIHSCELLADIDQVTKLFLT